MRTQLDRQLDVVGLGYCVYDILAIVPGLPDFDDVRLTHVSDLVYDGGGQVGTALTALARLGARVGYVGLLGDDREGNWLRDLFLQEGVDAARLRVQSNAGTNVCLILVEQATGRRGILCHQRVRPGDLTLNDADRSYIQKAGVLHLDGQFMPAALQAARWIKEAGGKVCFDGNHSRPGLDKLLPLVDWLVVTESFAAAYTAQPDLQQAANVLLALGIQVLVTTQGQRGCQVWTAAEYPVHGHRTGRFRGGDEHFSVPAFPVQAVDTTGAGDAFHGAFIYAMLQGWSLFQVVSFANGVAALNCQTLGGRRGLPSLAQVNGLVGNLALSASSY